IVPIFVVRRDELELVIELQLEAVRRELLRGAEELRVVRVATEAAGNGQNAHLRLLHELQPCGQLDLVRQHLAAGRKLRVPVDPEVRAVDSRAELESKPALAVRIVNRPRDRAAELDRS